MPIRPIPILVRTFLLLSLIAAATRGASAAAPAPDRPRLLVLTDIGGDPDDQQSMIRLLTYSNEFEIDGLIASAAGTAGELKDDLIRPDLIREIVDAYGQVRDKLVLHDEHYPTKQYLLDRVKSGNPHRGVKFIGDGHDTEGSKWIIAAVDRDDPRPLNITIWGGPTELAQALWRIRKDRTPEQVKQFIAKIRVYSMGHQDDTGPWILENFPHLFYVLGMAQPKRDMREAAYRGMYLGGDESLTSREWVDAHVRIGHGPMGALYPTKTWTAPNPHATMKEGDTPGWFYFLRNGLNDPAHPEWGGWGGRFIHEKAGLYRDAKDTVDGTTDARATVWRWRPDFQADFQARMDRCVHPFAKVNHAPVAVVNGDKTRNVLVLRPRRGSSVDLTAAESWDPDGDRKVHRWWVYAEAGSYRGDVRVDEADGGAKATVRVPADAGGKSIHVILLVTDDGKPALTGYRRVVLEVAE